MRKHGCMWVKMGSYIWFKWVNIVNYVDNNVNIIIIISLLFNVLQH